MDFLELARKRYSCKKYDGKQIEPAQLEAILAAGQAAPTAKNLQEQHVYVVQSPEKIALIDEVTPCRYNAPTVLVVTFNKENMFTFPDGVHTSGAEDAAIVATHMMLAAASMGVDSCWLNFFKPAEVSEKLGLPKNEEVLMLLDLGYAAEGTGPLANHDSRKDLSETVSYL